MREKIRQVVQEVLRGSSRTVRVTFKEEMTDGLLLLLAMHRGGQIQLLRDDMFRLAAAVAHGTEWTDSKERSTLVIFTSKFDEKLFVEMMADVLENIQAVN